MVANEVIDLSKDKHEEIYVKVYYSINENNPKVCVHVFPAQISIKESTLDDIKGSNSVNLLYEIAVQDRINIPDPTLNKFKEGFPNESLELIQFIQDMNSSL